MPPYDLSYGMNDDDPENGGMSTYGASASKPSAGGGRDLSGIPGLAALVGAAIAGPKSGMGNFLAGGVSKYAADQERKQLEAHKNEADQHSVLVKTIYAKVPELSKMAPDHPGVKELQKMYADALADDGIITPKEAAEMSAKIHTIEGSVEDFKKNKDFTEGRERERSSRQEEKDRATYEILQAGSPGLQSLSFEDAIKNPDIKNQITKFSSDRAKRAYDQEQQKNATVPVNLDGGITGYVPTTTAYTEQQAGQRAREMARASAGRTAMTTGASTQNTETRGEGTMLQQLMKEHDENPLAFQPTKNDGSPNKYYDPQKAQLYTKLMRGQLGGDPAQGPAAPTGTRGPLPSPQGQAPMAPPPVQPAKQAGPQEGDTAKGRDGRPVVFRGGRWVPR